MKHTNIKSKIEPFGKEMIIEPAVYIKAKDFALEMTNTNIQIKGLSKIYAIEKEYKENNKAISKILIERGITSKFSPLKKDVKNVERRLKRDDKKTLNNKQK